MGQGVGRGVQNQYRYTVADRKKFTFRICTILRTCTLIVQSAYKRGVNVPFCDLGLHFSSCKTVISGVF